MDNCTQNCLVSKYRLKTNRHHVQAHRRGSIDLLTYCGILLKTSANNISPKTSAYPVIDWSCYTANSGHFAQSIRRPRACHCPKLPTTAPANMSLLRPQLTSRLLQANAARCRHAAPLGARLASKTATGEYADRSVEPAPKSSSEDSPAPATKETGMIREEGPMEGMVDHRQPNYHAPIDHGTSLVYLVHTNGLPLIVR